MANSKKSNTKGRPVFREGRKRATVRIPDPVWEDKKKDIRAHYENATLEETMGYMEKTHGFIATRRQYVHRLGKWGITKYKSNTNSVSPTPQSPTDDFPARHFQHSSPDTRAELHILSEFLLYLGDLRYAFAIKAALYRDLREGGAHMSDLERKRILRMYVTDCIRITQDEATAKAARHMLENGLLYEDWVETDNSWDSVLFRILASRTYDSENGESSIIQIVEIINTTTVEEGDDGQEKLQTLIPREYRFDVLMYQVFGYALERYNEPTAADEQPIDVTRLLRQFKESQPAVKESMAQQLHPLLDWELLLRALNFCVSEISQRSFPDLRPDGKSARSNKIFLTLWSALQNHPSGWTDEETYRQFAISATELLSLAIGMIVEEAPKLPEDPRGLAASPPTEWAREGARVIKDLVSKKDPVLIDKFLDKAYAINVEIMLDDEERETLSVAAAKQLNGFRREAAQALGISDLPDLEEGAVIFQPLVADWDITASTSNGNSAQQGDHLEVNTTARRGARSRSRSQSHSPSATSSSQSPATNGNGNAQASDASEEDRIHLD
ncbi:hypothetical protein QBC40DRAFT_227890 [Triangularia verruculosa]|uniref:Clr5 domain-containing protein n=1 Tax=Triangularia verruculosa TaxID=2587418 RepID=A0AAN7AU43_9PEZI|nr:hypothetical protein QBC40DRAFT_227890 [Triangularia verruculosa]